MVYIFSSTAISASSINFGIGLTFIYICSYMPKFVFRLWKLCPRHTRRQSGYDHLWNCGNPFVFDTTGRSRKPYCKDSKEWSEKSKKTTLCGNVSDATKNCTAELNRQLYYDRKNLCTPDHSQTNHSDCTLIETNGAEWYISIHEINEIIHVEKCCCAYLLFIYRSRCMASDTTRHINLFKLPFSY